VESDNFSNNDLKSRLFLTGGLFGTVAFVLDLLIFLHLYIWNVFYVKDFLEYA